MRVKLINQCFLSNMIYLCLIPTGVIVCVVGMSAMGFFRKMEKEQQEVSA